VMLTPFFPYILSVPAWIVKYLTPPARIPFAWTWSGLLKPAMIAFSSSGESWDFQKSFITINLGGNTRTTFDGFNSIIDVLAFLWTWPRCHLVYR